MKTIPLTQGKVTLVDDADYEWLSKWNWHLWSRAGRHFYAVRHVPTGGKPRQRSLFMHSAIMGATHGEAIDHADGDGLNNRRLNLRFATRAENERNKGLKSTNSSGVKGAFLLKDRRRTKPWQARIKVNGEPVYLGYFATAEEAGCAYDLAAIILHGEFARLNRPASN